MKYILCGDSWAEKAYTPENYNKVKNTNDKCLGDFIGIEYDTCITPGFGNLDVLEKLVAKKISSNIPLLWIFTEPGRDWDKVYNDDKFGWLQNPDYMSIRSDLVDKILKKIYTSLNNPIGFIGGLSDFSTSLSLPNHWTVIHPSWQQFIADQLPDNRFEIGWGASDVGWRMHSDNVVPSSQLTFMWDEQIKEWCYWEEHDLFCHEHPTLKANELFAKNIQKDVIQWLNKIKATK